MKLVRVQKIAENYGFSLGTLYRWHSVNKFPDLFYSIGRVLFVDENELLRLAKKVEEKKRAEK